jgi:hypothetical protein
MRTEFGVERFACSCATCRDFCRYMPGFLIPADLGRMIPTDSEPFAWAETNVRASPGALVEKAGARFRIPTLVMRLTAAGCVQYAEGQCQIHAVAPFGCAFFGCRSAASRLNTDVLSALGLRTVAEAWNDPESLYRRLWEHLAAKHLTQAGHEILRRRLPRARHAP